MAIPDPFIRNFQTLLRAAEQGDLALVECLDAHSGDKRYVLCAVGREGRDYVLTPFGHLHDGQSVRRLCPAGRRADASAVRRRRMSCGPATGGAATGRVPFLIR